MATNKEKELQALIDEIKKETLANDSLRKDNAALKDRISHLEGMLGFWKGRAEELYAQLKELKRKL